MYSKKELKVHQSSKVPLISFPVWLTENKNFWDKSHKSYYALHLEVVCRETPRSWDKWFRL